MPDITILSKQLLSLKRNYQDTEDGTIRRYSLVYNSHEARKISVEAAFKDSLCALREMIRINPNFSSFEGKLFSKDSIHISRVNMSDDDNKCLNQYILEFLALLSPYIMLMSAQMSLEWLIFKYEINIHNEETFFMALLPFYSTKIFRRAMMLIPSDNFRTPLHGLIRILTERTLVFDDLVKAPEVSKWLMYRYFKFCNATIEFDFIREETHTMILSFLSSFMIISLSQYNTSFNNTIDKIIPFALHGILSEFKPYFSVCVCVINKIFQLFLLNPIHVTNYIYGIINNKNCDFELILKLLPYVIERQKLKQLDQKNILGFFRIINFQKIYKENILLADLPKIFFITVFDSFIVHFKDISDSFDIFPEQLVNNFFTFVKIALKFKNLSENFIQSLKTIDYQSCDIVNKIIVIIIESDKSVFKLIKSDEMFSHILEECNFVEENSFDYIENFTGDPCTYTPEDMLYELDRTFDCQNPQIWDLIRLESKLKINDPEILRKLKWNLATLLSSSYQKCATFVKEADLIYVFSEPVCLIPILSNILSLESDESTHCQLIRRLLSIGENLSKSFHYSLKHIISFKGSPEMFFALDFSAELYFLISVISDLEKVKNYYTLVHILLIININLINNTNYIPKFICRLFELLCIHKKIKCEKHVTICQTASEVFPLLASAEPTIHLTVSCILWSFNNVVQYLDYSICIKDYNTDYFNQIVYIAYSTEYNSSISNGVRTVLCTLLDKVVVGKNLKSLIMFTLEQNIDVTDNHSALPFIAFLTLLKDLVKSRSNLTYILKDILVNVLQLLNHEIKMIRCVAIDILTAIKVLRFSTEIINAVLKSSTIISDDHQYIKLCINKICRQSSSVSDALMDLLVNYIKNVSITKTNLFAFECLSFSSHPELPSLIALYIGKIISLTTNEKLCIMFMEYFTTYITSTLRASSKNEDIFQAINDWSISDVHNSPILQKMNDIFVTFTVDKRTRLLNNWIFYMAKNGSKRELMDLIISLPIDSNDLIKLYHSLFVTFFVIQDPVVGSDLILQNENFAFSNSRNMISILLYLTSSENKFVNQSRLLGFLLELSGHVSTFKDTLFFDKQYGIKQDALIKKLLKSINRALCSMLNTGKRINLQESVNFKHVVNILRHEQQEKIIKKCLIILMHASKLCPELLLDYLMPLFTFMGSYSVKKDDNNSLNVISRVIQVVIPQICESFSTDNKKNILPIIHGFCASFNHMPKHRHGPLFVTLVNTLPFKNSLGIVVSYLIEINSVDLGLDEFISEIIADLEIQQISQSFKYLLKNCQSNNNSAVNSQIDQVLVEDKEKIKTTLNLIIYIIESQMFKRKITPLDVKIEKIVSINFLKSLTYAINILNDFKNYSLEQVVLEKLILVMGELCPQLKFLHVVYQGIEKGGIMKYINILNIWSSASSQDPHRYKNVFKNIGKCLTELVNSSDKSNHKQVNICKKCIIIIKNFIKKTNCQKVQLIVFEQLLNLRFCVQESGSLSLCLGLAISESYKHISSDVFQSLPVILEFLYQLQFFTSVSPSSIQFNEMIVRCLIVIIGTNDSFSHIYLVDVFRIILNMPCNLYFKNLREYKSLLFQTHPEYSSLTLIKHITNNISYNPLLLKLHEFIVSLTYMSNRGVMFIILLLFMNIIRADRLSRDQHQDLYTEIFDNLLSYRCICHKQSAEFLPYYEKLIIFSSYEYFLKQNEDSLSKSLSIFLEHSLANFDGVYLDLRMISVYELLAFLTKKFGNTMVHIMKCTMETMFKHLTSILKDFDLSKIELFLSICKCIKFMLLNDISGDVPSNTLSILAKYLSDSFSRFSILDDKWKTGFRKQVVQAIVYICVRLQSHNKLNNFIMDLNKILSKSDDQRYITLITFEQICQILPNQAQSILHTILYNLENLKRNKNTRISEKAKILHDSLIKHSIQC